MPPLQKFHNSLVYRYQVACSSLFNQQVSFTSLAESYNRQREQMQQHTAPNYADPNIFGIPPFIGPIRDPAHTASQTRNSARNTDPMLLLIQSA